MDSEQSASKEEPQKPNDTAPPNKSPEKLEESEETGNKSEKATLLDEDLKNLPPEAAKMIQLFMSRERIGPMPNPIASKINEKHIDTILEHAERDEERQFKSSIHQKFFVGFIIVVFVGLFVFLTMWLSDSNRDLYMDIVKIVISFLGGLGSGYGIKAYRDRDKE